MLSKLTFSLVLVLVFAFATTSVYAQNVPATAIPDASGFSVVTSDTNNENNGIVGVTASAQLADMPNLADLLQFGGTIELLMPVGDPLADAATATSTFHASKAVVATAVRPLSEDDLKAAMHRVVITEIMWGLDGTVATAQWIELHNPGAAILPDNAGGLRLNFVQNARVYRVGQTIRDLDNSGGDFDATDEANTYVVVDAVSTVNRFGRFWEPKGQSGNSVRAANEEEPVSSLVSMYRKRSLEDEPSPVAYKFKTDGAVDGDPFKDGTDGAQWIESAARRNMTGAFIGTPGSVHVERPGAGKIFDLAAVTAATDGTGIIINEVRDDPSNSNVDWIELHNNSAAGTAAISVKNWRLYLITATENDDGTYKDFKQDVIALLPDYRIPTGGHLLIVNRDPEDTDLAGGTNLMEVADRKDIKRGATHIYHVSDGSQDNVTNDGKNGTIKDDKVMLDLPGSGKYLIVLKSGDNNNTHEQFVDFAGNGFFKNPGAGTDVWPLRGWDVPGDVDQADFGGDNTFANLGMAFARNSSAANRLHKDNWAAVSAQGGIGYERGVDLATSPGTPGYANNALLGLVSDDKGNADATDDVMFDGMITISEVMYDAGPRGRSAQWIELYNSSMTQAINLNGWEMEIRNKAQAGKFYVDASFEFEDATVLPNQTLLLISKSGPNDVADNRVYNLLAKHQRRLGLLPGDSILLSPAGFYINLTAKSSVGGRTISVDMDEAGNLMADGAQLTAMWELPTSDSGARQSLVRAYGAREIDSAGTPDAAGDGTMASSWMLSESGTFYYGDRNDVGSPGYRKGGPLPVSLSSFRPVRNQTTGHIDITWVTQSELNNAGFNILRSETKTGEFKVINVKGIIAGHGTTSEKHVYTFTDTTAKPNVVYYYQIEDVSLNGNRTTLRTTHLRGNVTAGGKLTTTWGDLKLQK